MDNKNISDSTILYLLEQIEIQPEEGELPRQFACQKDTGKVFAFPSHEDAIRWREEQKLVEFCDISFNTLSELKKSGVPGLNLITCEKEVEKPVVEPSQETKKPRKRVPKMLKDNATPLSKPETP